MFITAMQKRGALTVPQGARTQLALTDGQLMMVTVQAPDILILRAVPDAQTLFARFAEENPVLVEDTVPPTTGRWLPASALWHAQSHHESPWRSIWQDLSQGQSTRRCDPAIVAAWVEALPRHLPTFSRADHAAFLQAVCAWPGLELSDRLVWLTALDRWADATASWSDVVWAVRNATAEQEPS